MYYKNYLLKVILFLGLIQSIGATNIEQKLNSQDSSIKANNKWNIAYKDYFTLPEGLNGCFDLEDGLSFAKKHDKPCLIYFYKITSLACAESRHYLLSNSIIKQRLNENYVFIALCKDFNLKMPLNDWIVKSDGDSINLYGKKSVYIQKEIFGEDVEPAFYITNSDLNLKSTFYQDTSVSLFNDFLGNEPLVGKVNKDMYINFSPRYHSEIDEVNRFRFLECRSSDEIVHFFNNINWTEQFNSQKVKGGSNYPIFEVLNNSSSLYLSITIMPKENYYEFIVGLGIHREISNKIDRKVKLFKTNTSSKDDLNKILRLFMNESYDNLRNELKKLSFIKEKEDKYWNYE